MGMTIKKMKPGIVPSDVEGQFWYIEKKKIEIRYTKLMLWIHEQGYRLYENEIVQINENIISIIELRDLKAALLKVIEPHIVDRFYELVPKIFSGEGGVMSMLWKLEDLFIRDTEKETWIFFKNYALKICDDRIFTLRYSEISGYVWESSIVQRDYYIEDFTGSDAEKFVKILGGNKFEDLCLDL